MQPKLRFNGFTDEWKQVILGEIAEIVTGSTPSTSDSSNYGNEFLFASPADLGNSVYIDNTLKKLSAQGFAQCRQFPKNSILYTCIGSTIGKAGIAEKRMTSNQQINAILPNNSYDTYYLFCELATHNTELIGKASTQAVPIINKSLFATTLINFASLEEQKAIGEFFKQLDEQVNCSEAEIARLKQLKKGALQAMFPQPGENIPKIRFNGFSNPWQQKTAKDLFRATNVRNRPDLPVLSAFQDLRGMAPRDENGYNISHNISNEVTYKVIKPGDFVIHLRSFQGGFAHSSYLGIASPAYTVFEFVNKEEHDEYFWKCLFRDPNFISRLTIITYGIRDGRSISFNEFSSMSFLVPSYEEQAKIGEFFKQLDAQISLQEKKLLKLKQLKQAALNQMFV